MNMLLLLSAIIGFLFSLSVPNTMTLRILLALYCGICFMITTLGAVMFLTSLGML